MVCAVGRDRVRAKIVERGNAHEAVAIVLHFEPGMAGGMRLFVYPPIGVAE